MGLSPLSLSQFASNAASSPAHAVRSVLAAFDLRSRVRAAQARFDPSRFAGWPDAAAAGLYLAVVHLEGSAPPSFAIVGDYPLAYFLLRQPPPYESELYDAAPLSEQHAMVSALREQSPSHVIWRKDFDQDGVLYNIRDPLLFSWMVANYVPVKVTPSIDILRRRRAGEGGSAAFWRTQFAAPVDLGYIPSFSSALSAAGCVGGRGCVQYAVVHSDGPVQGADVALNVSGNGVTYSVHLKARSNVHDYPVRLDRLWFWRFVGPRPGLSTTSAGYDARLVGRRSGDNLY
jgi:hypothetical protein